MTTQVPAVPPKDSADVEVVPDVADAGEVNGLATPTPSSPAPNSAAAEEPSATAPDGDPAASSEGPSVESLAAEVQELRDALKQQMASTPGIAQGPQDEPAENFSLAQFMQSTLGR